ncbi:MAG TPA: citrate synthase [Actinomycetota bacterium]|nr:citrate synthase [Actinomycetota bacterium]
MTESTAFLTSAQAAARLGVKTATLYAYVSRGLIPRHRSDDGRTSLFDAADVARLARRGGAERTAPSDVTVGSELTLVDAGGIWYRGVDVLRACRELQFEEVASLLWTGSIDRLDPWNADQRSLRAGAQAMSALKRGAPPADRLPLIAAGVAAAHAARTDLSAIETASDVMACLVDCLPGRSDGTTIAQKLTAHFGGRSLVDVFDAALSLTCERGLTHGALAARLTIATGGGIAAAVAAAIQPPLPNARALVAIEQAFAKAVDGGASEAAASLDPEIVGVRHPFRTADPRTPVLLSILGESAPAEAELVSTLTDALRKRGVEPNVWYALAATTWAAGMVPGAAGAIALIAQAAGWLAHALEETNRPTPYRPRLAYTGPAPRESTPRRTLDAVTQYLSRD